MPKIPIPQKGEMPKIPGRDKLLDLHQRVLEQAEQSLKPPVWMGVDVARAEGETAADYYRTMVLGGFGVCGPQRVDLTRRRKHVDCRIVEPLALPAAGKD
jgi:hypothetical protein